MNKVLDRDEVYFIPAKTRMRGKQTATIDSVINRPRQSIFARYFTRSGRAYATPCSHKIPRTILLEGLAKEFDIKDDSIIEVALSSKKDNTLPDDLRGELLKNLGDGSDLNYEIDLAISEFGLRNEFTAAALAEAESSQVAVDTSSKNTGKTARKSLVGLPFVTIDGADARDFDDAVYCKNSRDGWLLWVAIADVAHYVKPGGELDKEASIRTSSVYFPNRVVPMLPEHLSNGLCSLKPNEDRLAMVCSMKIDRQGKVMDKEFFEAVINSRQRLIYEEVASFVESGFKGNLGKNKSDKEVENSIQAIHELTKVLLAERKQRGALDFSHLEETQIELSDKGQVDGINKTTRNIAHMMIEECMLLANISTAEFINKCKLPFCYRINPPPDKEKLDELRYFLRKYKIKVPLYPPKSSDYSGILAQVNKFPEADVLEMAILRSMKQASYTPRNEGHFGLSYDHYTHFTSPIRRYADLLNHRAIKYILHGDKKNNYPYAAADISETGNRCSVMERVINKSVWQVMDAFKCHYLAKHGKKEYDGIIVHISEIGFFVRIDGLPIEGLVRVKSLTNDFYRYNHAERTLQGARRSKIFSIGDKVRVGVEKINTDERKIDFLLI